MEKIMIDYKERKCIKGYLSGPKLEFAIENTKLSLDKFILSHKEELYSAVNKVSSAKQEYPMDIIKICVLSERVKFLENTIRNAENLKKELSLC